MDQFSESSKQIKPLAYRLRQNVRLSEKEGVLHLRLSYPLKSVMLNQFWRAVLDLLAKGPFIPLNDILSMTENRNRDDVEFFLNDLVRKGFLEQAGVADMEMLPTISIIIPVYNRPKDIEACLDSLMRLDYPKDKLEIIVVDDASTDETPDVISRFPVYLMNSAENRQAPFCRNLAADQATGEILAFIDSDCRADQMWLQELVPAFKDPVIAAVGGMVDSSFGTRTLDRYEHVRSSLKMGLWPKRSAKNNPFFYVPSCNFLVRKDIFLKTNGFNELLVVGEDVDLCWRICEQGYHIEYKPVGRIFHKHRNRIISFCCRRFDYGTSEPLLNRLHPQKIKQMVFAPGAFLFWIMVVMAIFFKSVMFLLLAGIILLGEAVFKLNLAKQRGITIQLSIVLISVIRSHFSFFYHCCAFFSRYYLIGCIIFIPLLPMAAAVIAGMHLLAGLVEYGLKKPHMNLILFLFFFTLEQLAYQLGVWWECLKTQSFKAVNPQITIPQLQGKYKPE